jgi:hypothetical protein
MIPRHSEFRGAIGPQRIFHVDAEPRRPGGGCGKGPFGMQTAQASAPLGSQFGDARRLEHFVA